GLGTVCSALVEILQRCLSWRSAGLRLMVQAYYREVLQPQLAVQAEDPCKLCVDALTRNVLAGHVMQIEGGSRLANWVRSRMLPPDDLDTAQFLKRLPDTPVFALLKNSAAYKTLQQELQNDEAAAKALLERLANRYDQFGEAASAYFKSRARMLSMLVGIALALVCNINAMRIFDTFLKNPDLAARMQEQAESIRAAADAQAARAAAQAGTAADAETLREMQGELVQAKQTLDAYRSLGLPIGWDFYPNCHAASQDPKCLRLPPQPATDTSAAGAARKLSDQRVIGALRARLDVLGIDAGLFGNIARTAGRDPQGMVAWLLVLLLSGGLIGLGGPFWFSVVSRLSPLKGQAAAMSQAAASTPEQVRAAAIDSAASQLAPVRAAAPAAVPGADAGAAAPTPKRPWDDKEW
ncbi:MAG: hypothetical protein JNJ60_01555, partial [Rhodocyclaceae bacterium]|nr:hypothetical protein [Rhodocyclaceae bacterium]